MSDEQQTVELTPEQIVEEVKSQESLCEPHEARNIQED